MTKTKIESTIENWDNEALGSDEKFVKQSELAVDLSDDMLGLQAISIRLERSLVSDMKEIAKYNGLAGYQPLMRRVMNRFVEAEMKNIAREIMSNKAMQEGLEDNVTEKVTEEPEPQKCA